jgi:hypothetical protein
VSALICKNVLLIPLLGLLRVMAFPSWMAAQNCGSWLDVKSWQATYTITGKGSGADVTGINWTINHQYTAVANLTNGPNGCSQILIWTGVPSTATGSGNDSGSSDCETIAATGTVAPPFPSLALIIDPVQNMYYVKDGASIPAQYVYGGCGHGTYNVGLALGPLASPGIPLPSGVDVLQQSNFTFTAPSVVPAGVPTNWTLSFKLTPSRAWVKVWMNGGKTSQVTTNREPE